FLSSFGDAANFSRMSTGSMVAFSGTTLAPRGRRSAARSRPARDNRKSRFRKVYSATSCMQPHGLSAHRRVRAGCRWIPPKPGTLGFLGLPAFQCRATTTEKAGWTLTNAGVLQRVQPTFSRHRQHESANVLREKL